MKKYPILIGVTLLALAPFRAEARISVEEIQPPHWWTGMKDTSLQLQIQGHDIRQADLTLDYPGVRVDSVVRLDGSPDWQYVYLNISPEARPGKMKLQWKKGKEKASAQFELRQRKPQKYPKGFSAADVLYLVMPDRFADGDPANNELPTLRHPAKVDRSDLNVRHGGDIAGIMKHMDYLDSLGITALWVNPVLENDMPGGSYHGYATTDYYKIDPRFGTNAEYTAMIDSLHGRGIKTVMDMIFNHAGIGHPWIDNPPASDWFNLQDDWKQTNYRLSTIADPYATDYDRMVSEQGWFVHAMPDLNQLNTHVMKYLVQNSIWWIEESGIDAIRMDTYPYADRHAMARWNDAVVAEYPDFTIVGECWFADPAAISYWQKGSPIAAAEGFDSRLPVVMDFPLMIKSREMKPFTEQTDPWNGLNKIYDHLSLDYIYADPMNLLRFLDNHDTERVILEVPDSLGSWKQAVAFLLTAPGIPQLYYGTELLMAGDRKPGDGNVRRDMPGGFAGDARDAFSRQGRTALENEAFDFISTICKWRKNSKAVTTGGMKHFMPDNGLYLYRRKAGDDEVIVVMNGVDADNDVDMSRYAEVVGPADRFVDILTGREVTLVPADGHRVFAPRQTMILQKL